MKAKILGAAVIGLVLLAVLSHFGWLPSMKVQEAVVPQRFDLPADAGTEPVDNSDVTPVSLPSTKTVNVSGPEVHINMWAWNAQMGLIFANGGPATTSGSLMEKHKVNLKLTRQDDTNKSKADQIVFAQALADGKTGNGPHFVIIMGDQAAQHIASMNKELEKLGPEYRAEVAGAVGYSVGEDGFWGPQEWKDNPESMRGGVVFGVLREGDWNIAQYAAAQNNIKNNPDERVYDPDALNWVAADDYLKAVDMLINGYCETRDVVVNGKRTGNKKNICDNDVKRGAVTWTPGDVNLAKKKGGYVRILSTKENRYQMPAVLIGIHKWDTEHAKIVQELLAATFEGSDQVKHFPQALQRAGTASYAVYNKEESPAYWVKYYKGVTERDKTGNMVPLGGSSVMNLADNLLLFGLLPGSGGIDGSLFNATYEGFGTIVKQQYPKLVSDFPPTVQAVNTSFIEALSKTSPVGVAEVETFTEGASIEPENVVAKKNWNIQFDTGKDTVTTAGETTLNDLYNQLLVGGALAVEIQGHTDNVGDPGLNQSLSERRAFAVKSWLESKAPTLFPDSRVNIQAFGSSKPLVPNTTAENRARNRRVTILLGTK